MFNGARKGKQYSIEFVLECSDALSNNQRGVIREFDVIGMKKLEDLSPSREQHHA
jgi:hypothetical protein